MSIRDSVLPWLERAFRNGGILSYHGVVEDDPPSREMHVSVSCLRAQLEFLRSRYAIIPLRELVLRHRERRSTDRCVAITFDDAYRGVESLVAPMVAALDISVTIFVATAAAEHGDAYWWDLLEHARRENSQSCWARMLAELNLAGLAPDASHAAAVRDHVLVRRAGRWTPHVKPDELGHPLLRSMDFAALRRVARDDRFEFGCHTTTHPALPFLGADEQESEMRHAHRRLSEELPRVVPIVAYPYGLYDRASIEAARRASLRAGVTMQGHGVAPCDDVLALPRIGVSEDWSARAIALRINSGVRPLVIARNRGTRPRLPVDRLSAEGA